MNAVGANAVTSRRKRAGGRVLIRLLISLAVVLGTAALSVLFTSLFGHVHGEEFSPDTFQRRSFYYYQIPVLHIQVWPITRIDRTGDLEKYLTKQTYVGTGKPAEPRWDLVSATWISRDSYLCDARILCKYLDTRSANFDVHWLKWTEDNPALAKLLWPAISKIAGQQLYIFAPELFELASGASDPVQFQRDLNSRLANKYLQLAKSQQQMGHHQTAVDYFTESLSYDAQNAAAFNARASSWDALAKPDKAVADRADAKKLAGG
jgi:tetratricopeptide (TPR) repeat protein